MIVSSTLIGACDNETCTGCGKCAKACPVGSIRMVRANGIDGAKQWKLPEIDERFCLGCGVCALKCDSKSMRLVKRKQRVIHPEDMFEKVILLALDKGTLQNQLFADPGRFDHRFMRGLLGGFLRLTAVKKALMSDQLRSRFLQSMRTGAKLQGKGWLAEL